MKRVVKKNYKTIIAFILGIIVSSIGVYAATLSSSEVTYDNNNSGIKAENLQGAIDELYSKAKNNAKIIGYEYNEKDDHKCINGEESTCVKTECYKKGQASCKQGTIIRYYVNSHEYHYFYVLHDDGNTITMQQRENTVRNIPWHAGSDDNSKGPDTVLPILEAATSTWTNVNVIEYTPGETEFNGNKFTGCTYNSELNTGDFKIRCESNTYDSKTLVKRKARARIITAQEAGSTGCLVWKDGSKDDRILSPSKDAYNNGSCPDWMHNYMYQSADYGGSYSNDTTNENSVYDYAYWTMSANSGGAVTAWDVGRTGNLSIPESSDTNIGARAVVEISKSNL